MKQAVELARKMYKDPEKNWMPELEIINLHSIFRPVYTHNLNIENINKIVAFCILAYDNNSEWIDPRKDRTSNKIQILQGIGVDSKNKIYKEILEYNNEHIQEVILQYLVSMTDARWREAVSLLDYADKMILYSNRKTTEKNKVGTSVNKDGVEEDEFNFLDPLEISKINKEKGDLLLKSIESRKVAEEILKTMENDFQRTDAATQGDFGFAFSNPKAADILQWENRIRKRREGKQ